jgi:TetR/AcrR family tetracycline transcriptional repressor
MSAAPGNATPLSREAFAAAALEFIDENGVDALTLRALGEQMGVHYTAVYRYFPGKDDLLEAALTHMLEESGVTVPESGTPRERILGLLRGLRAAFARHPGMALPNLTAQDEQATAEFVRGALQFLEEMGLSGRDLVVAYQMLENFHVGVTAYDFADYPDGLEKRMRGRRLVGHPAMDEVSRSLDDMQAVSDEAFEATANALLDACEAMAARTKRP